jgi:hypothetical protein
MKKNPKNNKIKLKNNKKKLRKKINAKLKELKISRNEKRRRGFSEKLVLRFNKAVKSL